MATIASAAYAAFVYTFARFDLPHREAPRADLDLASPGVVMVLDEGRFDALADRFGRG